MNRRSPLVLVSLVAGVLGLVLVGVGFAVDHRRAAFSYLAAYTYVLSIALGALVLLLMTHAANARWFLVFRRIAEAVALALIPLAVLFIPIVAALGDLYVWVHPEQPGIGEEVAERLHHKLGYLSPPFFIVRSIVYLGAFVATILLLRRWSMRQNDAAAAAPALRLRRFSTVALPPIALAITFGSFDWLMSLTPAWYSTMYGVYFWAGGFVAALALCAFAANACQRAGTLPEIRPPHYYALGRLMLAFTIFWAYIAYAQGFIIWIANKPDEVTWYVPRLSGSWGVASIVLLATQFVIPFVLLLSQELKYRRGALAAVAVVILVGHAIDAYWMVLPVFHPEGVLLSWMDAAALVGVAGIALAFGLWRLGAAPLLPLADPRLPAAITYKSSMPATSGGRQ